MTARQRILAALSFQPTDTIPTYDIVNNVALYQTYGGVNDPDDGAQVLHASGAVYKALGIDMTRGFYNPRWQIGAVEAWKKYVGAPADGWIVRYNRDTSWIAKHPHETLQELEAALPRFPDADAVIRDYTEQFSSRRACFTPDTLFVPSIGGFLDIAYRYAGYELFCEGMYDSPELMDHMLDIFAALQSAYLKAVTENRLSPVIVYCDDIAFKSSLLFSPDYLRRHYFPRLQALFKPVIDAGIKVIFHSDGNLRLIMGDLIACGIHGLNPLEKLADMDIVDIRKQYPKLALVGGVDCSQLLPFGSRADIRRELTRIMNSIGGMGGLILGSTSEIHNEIPPDNAKYLFDTIHELGARL